VRRIVSLLLYVREMSVFFPHGEKQHTKNAIEDRFSASSPDLSRSACITGISFLLHLRGEGRHFIALASCSHGDRPRSSRSQTRCNWPSMASFVLFSARDHSISHV